MNRRTLSVVLVIILIVIWTIPPQTSFSQEIKSYNLAILDLDAKGISQIEAAYLTEYMRGQVTRLVTSDEYKNKTGINYTVVERSQIDKIFEQFEIQNTGCTDVSCAVEFGKMLSVERIVIGSVGLVGQTYSIATRIVDVESTSTIAVADYTFTGQIDDLLTKGITSVADELMYGKKVKGHRFVVRRNVPLLLGAGSGIAAIFFKIKADRFYEDQKTAENLEALRKAKNNTERYDNISYVLGGISVISLGFSLYEFLKGEKIEVSDNSMGVRISCASGMRFTLMKKF